MLKKKLMAVVAACALALALPTAAFAAGDWSTNAYPGTVNSESTTTAGYLYTSNVTVTSKGMGLSVSGPESAIGESVTVTKADGSQVASGEMSKNAMTGKATFQVNVNALGDTFPATFTVKVIDPDYVAPVTPPATTDTTDPAADNTDNGTAGSTDNSAADDKKAADNSKTSPKTGVDMGGIALATASALAAAGCVAFALRKKIAINE